MAKYMTPNIKGLRLIEKSSFRLTSQAEVRRGTAYCEVLTVGGVEIQIDNDGDGGSSMFFSPQGPEALAGVLEEIREGFDGATESEEMLGLYAHLVELVRPAK
jgi:hypothetical protein